jgi:integrating conjugative element protein (TIGR03765 family)
MNHHTTHRILFIAAALLGAASVRSQTHSVAFAESLIVVEDRGGVSALPYYQVLSPQAGPPSPASPSSMPTPRVGDTADAQAAMLPVRSMRLAPGVVQRRLLPATPGAIPGVKPLFLVGDDAHSRAWLQQHQAALRALQAVGLVVNVESMDALRALRRVAPGLILSPVCGDELAQRLDLRHYPVLITSSGIEQ